MNKKVYVCEVEVQGGAGMDVVMVCEDLDAAREWVRDSFLAFKQNHEGEDYLSENKEYRWFAGVCEGRNRWECYHMSEHIGWYVTEVDFITK